MSNNGQKKRARYASQDNRIAGIQIAPVEIPIAGFTPDQLAQIMGEMLSSGFQLIPAILPLRLEQNKIALVGHEQRPVAMCLVFMRAVLVEREGKSTDDA